MKHLAIGPGAMAYFAFAGALSALKDVGALNDLEIISGASAGSILAAMYVLARGDTQKLMHVSLDVPVGDVTRPVIKTFLKSFGLVGTHKIQKIFEQTVFTFLGTHDVTFAELWNQWPHIKLYISAFCVELKTTHYFSVDTTPGMSVVKALCMSVSVPFLFASVTHGPWHYIDGGTTEETPCSPFIGKPSVCIIRMCDWDTETNVRDLKTYALQMLGTVMGMRHSYRNMFPSIIVSAEDIFNFRAPFDSKVRMFVRAYISCMNTLPRLGIDPVRMPEQVPETSPEHLEPVCASVQNTRQTLLGDTDALTFHHTPSKSLDTDASESVAYTPLPPLTNRRDDNTCLDTLLGPDEINRFEDDCLS